MSAFAVTRAYHFSAAHQLANPALSDEENARIYGQCFRQHGHNYGLEVTVAGALDPATGMSVDLGVVDAAVKRRCWTAWTTTICPPPCPPSRA